MKITRKTLFYLIVFIVFFAESIATTTCYWEAVSISAVSTDTVLLFSQTPGIESYQAYSFLRSPAATLVSGLCMLKLTSMFSSRK